MGDVLSQLRDACATVAQRARHVRINAEAIPEYAATLPLDRPRPAEDPGAQLAAVNRSQPTPANRERLAAFWLTLDAINFGSGWFPTLHKPSGQSGYHTIAAGIERRFATRGPWAADELREITAAEIAHTLAQDPGHELMGLFACSLADLGRHIADDYDARFEAAVGDSAGALVERLASWQSFRDVSTYDGITVPFLKRAQIAAADLARAGTGDFEDLHRLTMFADNLVPHVLRLDGILTFDDGLVERIERQQLIAHDSPEEIEIRACAVHAVELVVAERPGTRAADVDQLLWLRGQTTRYKSVPRHRSRGTAY